MIVVPCRLYLREKNPMIRFVQLLSHNFSEKMDMFVIFLTKTKVGELDGLLCIELTLSLPIHYKHHMHLG